MASLWSWVLVLLVSVCRAQELTTREVSSCTCGFYDEDADLLFTDSTIVYFNETNGVPDDLVIESFEHRYDLGWNTVYRQGAKVDNVNIVNDTTARNLTSLELAIDPSDKEHLVNGASIRTKRQDIFFGSFRSSMRAPRSWHRGSALSMLLYHNETERWNIDVMNTDNSSQAWVSMLANGVFPDIWLGKNFTDLIHAGEDPWYYLEYRVDWTRDNISYYIDGQLQKTYTKKENGTLPSTPAPLKWQHWSTGNKYSCQGPPTQRSQANIGWTRIFYNSSLATDKTRKDFDARCTRTAACPMSDNALRGSTAYDLDATKPWKQAQPKWTIPWVPLAIDIAFLSVFTILLVKTLWRRASWDSLYEFLGLKERKETAGSSAASDRSESDAQSTDDGATLANTDTGSPLASRHNLPNVSSYASLSPPPAYSVPQTPAPQYQTPVVSPRPSRTNSADDLTIQPIYPADAQASSLISRTQGRRAGTSKTPRSIKEDVEYHGSPSSSTLVHPSMELSAPPTPGFFSADVPQQRQDPQAPAATERKTPAVKASPAAGAALPRQRIDYLAGFISMSALLVTVNHFCLTFFASVLEPGLDHHYSSELWARKTIATYFLDPLWIGPFLMISTRFLISNYLRTGNLGNMAQKIVSRPFRLLTPVASIALLEYFLMDSGAVNWLEYLPSVTWSQWPYVTLVQNPGVFISEIVELAFLIPNAAPQITNNYCTGVLWTIPVQLQGAWQTLIGLIMVKQCKTPWKRMAFYAFCIANHWYGLSWGSYYYAGVLLADLDLTFKYKKWLHARPFVYYPILWFLIAVTLGGFTLDLIPQYTGVQYAEKEYGWHPDTTTGLAIVQAGRSLYPDYYIPRLNALITTVSMQTIVEISPVVQRVLSVKVLQWVFPHIFTIYLIHGFIMWSAGSWAMVTLFSYGLPYWLCVLLTAIICYGMIFAVLPILTPPIELLGKNFTLTVWEHASQEPAPRKPTTYPFGRQLLNRDVDAARADTPDTVDEKKGKGPDGKATISETISEV
ncbi:CAZyme family GH16 [Paecilomyces variotii]|nr:CAZyme family GH16 [Paecilomyces variotii]KAJ9226638.1 CAZyme family GH16 [Paecilomyces variotii]KAJ9320401.1 CAZyme family GH16 [Paecilomyces variotii]KAJ9335048.1 CAZyme family GH16 [Paecilomyces variotii]KAJ9406475.1 CAZyme family GH16 [Paecilomyces variotii]